MKKTQLYELYEDYLKNNPQDIYVKNIRRLSGYDERIDRMYIQHNSFLMNEELPECLTIGELCRLDEKHNHALTWKIVESDVTDEQIAEFEQKNGITLPQKFREYVQGYAILQACFYPKCVVSEDCYPCGYYNQNTGEYILFRDEELEQEENLIGNVQIDFFGINNPNVRLPYGCFEKIGMIHLGNLDSGDMVFLDCETGEVQSWDHEMNNSWDAESKEEFEEESNMGDFWFKDFDTFLEWVFGKTVYDFDEAQEKYYQWTQGRSEIKNEQKNIIYL